MWNLWRRWSARDHARLMELKEAVDDLTDQQIALDHRVAKINDRLRTGSLDRRRVAAVEDASEVALPSGGDRGDRVPETEAAAMTNGEDRTVLREQLRQRWAAVRAQKS